MPNAFDKAKIDSLSLEVGLQMSSQKGQALLGLCIKNYTIIRNLTTHKEFLALLNDIEFFLEEFFSSYESSTRIVQSLPYYFIVVGDGIYRKKIASDLSAAFAARCYSGYDVQFVVSCVLLHDQNPKALVIDLINTLESFGGASGLVEFNHNITQNLIREYDVLSNLKSSIKVKLARFAYQPIINCITGETEYYECLLRIPNEEGELISAGPAILLAEKYGIINIVDEAVIEMATNELNAAKDLHLSINISNIGLLDARLIEKAVALLKEPAIASRLVIEITETSVNQDFKKTSDFVNTMRGLGCKIAIDDFGAGSSSFSQLKNIKFDILKIDGSLIRGITTNTYNKFLVETLVKIAETAGAVTVAEFVEDGAIAKFLMDSKVNFMQGNFFSPARNFRTWSKK